MAQNRFGTRVEETVAPQTQQPEATKPPRREPQPDSPPQQQQTRGQQQAPVQQRQAPAPKRFSWRPKDLFQFMKKTINEWSNDKVPRMGAALAYYTIFSIAPLLVIAIAIAGFVFGADAVQGRIMGEIQGLVGRESARAVQTMIQSAHKPAHGVIATIVGIAILLVGASGVFSEMQDALNTIWKVDTTSKSGIWNLLRARFLSFGMVLGIGFSLLVSLLLSAAISAAAGYVEGFVSVPPTILHVVDFLFSLFFIAALMALIFKLLPDIKIPWSDVWVGAALTSLLFTLGKFLIGFYIGKSVTMSAYGAAGSVVIILAWIYYSAQLLYFGAEFTQVYSRECGSQCQASAPNRKASPA